MKQARYQALQVALLCCLAFMLAAATLPHAAKAQQTAEPKETKETKSTSPVPFDNNSAQPAAATTPLLQPSPEAPAVPKTGGTEIGGDHPTLVTNTDLINVTVTVTDNYGRYVSGLGKNAFSLFDEKEQQNIVYFSDDDSPVSVGVVFDVSGSMSGDKIRKAREALSKFIKTSHDSDEYFLIGFNSRAQLLLDKTRDGDAVLNKLTFVEPRSNTALYDACYLGVEKVQRGVHKKRAILLISDGQDNNSRYTFSELRRLLKESDVVVYAVGILGGSDANSGLGMEGQGILDELSGVSGGKAFFPNTNAEMDEIFEKIALELRHQYSIGYRPSNFTNDGKWHRIKVKVTPPRGLPRLSVRSRDGYFAVMNPR